jgi:hypothetical protein
MKKLWFLVFLIELSYRFCHSLAEGNLHYIASKNFKLILLYMEDSRLLGNDILSKPLKTLKPTYEKKLY